MKQLSCLIVYAFAVSTVTQGLEPMRNLYLKSLSKESNQLKILSQALCATLRKTSQCVDIFSVTANNFLSSNFLDEFFSTCLSNNLKHSITKSSNYSRIEVKSYCFSLFLVETFENQKLPLSSDNNLIVSLKSGQLLDLVKIFESSWKSYIFNVIALISDFDKVEVVTFMPFSSKGCGDATPVVINTFSGGKFANDNLFTNKTKNLFGCLINIVSSSEALPFVVAEKTPNGNYDLKGAEIDLTNTLAKALNFKINYSYTNLSAFILPNGTITGVFKSVNEGDADLAVGNWWLKINRIKLFGFTNPYATDRIVFLIPPGKDLTSLEKLIFPFSVKAWISIALAFVLGIIFILIIRLKARHVQEISFGSARTSHVFNMFSVFIGQTQTALPISNFAKLLLTSFMLFSLVIRSAYQGSFYRLLQSDLHHREIQSIDEIIRGTFKIFTTVGNIDILHGTPEFRERLRK